MKKRDGFVSNSSTTSFTCELCGHSEAGYDGSADELGFWMCPDGHEICQSCIPDAETSYNDDYGDVIDKDICPVCSFQVISLHDLARYFAKNSGVTRDEAFAAIKAVNKRRKKLYNHEYVSFVIGRTGVTTNDIMLMFSSYEEFMAAL